jgi:sodium/hydrogen exchanger-like protein 6/7
MNNFKFDDAIFFNFMLPPIIFSAGYNLRRKSFFKHMWYILVFGIVGTLVSFSLIAPLTYLFNSMGVLYYTSDNGYEVLNLSLQEILLFSSVIGATDTVSALTFIKEENEPKLFSLLFGEGIINDAVCIVLFKTINNFNMSNKGKLLHYLEFTKGTPILLFGEFLQLFLLSLLVGIIVGLLCTLFLKKMKYFRLHRVQECCIIIFFAFFSYSISQILGLSAIISLLFCAMFMSHYSFYNISFQAREESSVVARIMSSISEAFIFTYLGLTFIPMMNSSFSITFISIEFVIVIFARYTSVYLISFLLK